MVSVEKCDSYEYEKIKSAVQKCADNLGGFGKYIKKGEIVLIKPNLIAKKEPDDAATTHPYVVAAIAELVSAQGAKAIIGDSPGGPFNAAVLKALYKTTGMEDAAALSGASLSYDTTSTTVDNPSGERLKKLTVTNMALKADKIISAAKFKSHSMMYLTGAAKNMYGTIPGTTKAEYHFFCQDTASFANALIDICLFTKPVLSFTDAVYGMEGNGPTGGDKRFIGAIIASENPFEADLAMAQTAGAKPEEIPMLKEAIRRRLCTDEAKKLEFCGCAPEQFIMSDFKIPRNKSIYFLGDNVPVFLENFIKRHMSPKPVFNSALCIGCGECMRSCPAKVITMPQHFPVADIQNCIRCYCCQELCPKKAVTIKVPAVLKLMAKF